MRLSLSSTSTRTFLIIPLVVLADQVHSGRRIHLKCTPLLAWGYFQYRLVGNYRVEKGGGPAGMSQGFPEHIVTSGIYRWTRNPMYLGQLIFLAGLTLMTRSPVALGITAYLVRWFDNRVQRDEDRLMREFGATYASYKDQVPRWVGLPKELLRRPDEVQAV